MTEETASTPERTLVLCVDRDDDLGVKAAVRTPVVGREQNINAAVNLALRDPEEPDANAIFEAVRIYDRLKEMGADKQPHAECEIATIAGSELGDVGADKELVSKLTEVLRSFPATEVVLVTDGFADRAILPLVQSRVPVTSVRRVTIRHSESIEETVWLFSRYLKMLFENPRYARAALGLPGLLLVIIGVLSISGFPLEITWLTFLIVFGAFLVVKGFMLDKAARSFYLWVQEYSPPPIHVQIAGFAAVAGFLLTGIGLYLGIYQASTFASSYQPTLKNIGQWLGVFPRLLGEFLSQSIFLVVAGISILLSGRAIRWLFEHDSRLLRTFVIVVVVAWSAEIFYEASQILIMPTWPSDTLVVDIIVGIVLAVASVVVTSMVHRRYTAFFREKGPRIGEG